MWMKLSSDNLKASKNFWPSSWWKRDTIHGAKPSGRERITAIQSMLNNKQMTQKIQKSIGCYFWHLKTIFRSIVALMKDNQAYTAILIEVYITLKYKVTQVFVPLLFNTWCSITGRTSRSHCPDLLTAPMTPFTNKPAILSGEVKTQQQIYAINFIQFTWWS